MTVQDLTIEARAALTHLVIRGMIRGDVPPALAEAVDAGLAMVKGPLVMPAAHAQGVVGEWLLIADSDERAALTVAFHRFLPLNRALRELCTAWQCLPGGGINEHVDAAYDAGIRDQFDDVHDAIGPILRRAERTTPDFAGYAERLQAALERFDEDKPEWLASPIIDSYHTVWMHIHQLFLLHLGMSRIEDAALEENLVSGGPA